MLEKIWHLEMLFSELIGHILLTLSMLKNIMQPLFRL